MAPKHRAWKRGHRNVKRKTILVFSGAAIIAGLLSVSPFFSGRFGSPPVPVAARPASASWGDHAQSFQRLTPSGSQPGRRESVGISVSDEFRFREFSEWFERYQSAKPGVGREELEREGVRLAEERRAAMSSMIRENPRRALALAVPAGVRRRLPPAIANLLETPVSGRGSLFVLAALAEHGREQEVTPVVRIATINGVEYDAHVYGRREGEPSRVQTAMNGIAVDQLFAVHEDPVRLIDSSETAAFLSAANEPRCAISAQPADVNGTPAAAEMGGEIIPLCGPAHAATLNEQVIRAESTGGEDSGISGDLQASAYTEGVKRLILIRVDFPDLAGSPFPDNTGPTLISGLNDFYRESSFGKAGFALHGSGSAMTPTFRMPQAASSYGTNNGHTQLRSDARNAAAAAGYVLGNYDFDLICFGAVPGWGWAGLGYVGAPGVWLRGYFTVGVAGHELGHNFGLNHANYWDTQGQSVIGPGTSAEYGDVYDTMGSANGGANHFNARYKAYLNWLSTSETLTATTSGTYRLHAHDDTNSTGVRGIKIVRDSSTNYWVEFRKKFSGNQWLMNGVGIRWAGNGNQRSQLLDTTPGSPNGKNDSALVVGRTFSDPAHAIHITPIRRLGTSPDALDVVVNLGTFPANVPPAVTIAASETSVAPGGTVVFNALTSDANGDLLAYYWDFGDGSFGTNGAAAGKAWNVAGEYLVQCTVSDMKGGTASDSVIVTVGFPGTYRISGRLTAAGAPVPGARVYVSGSRMTYSDSDGSYVLTGLPAGSYTVSVALDGFAFIPNGFSNPVSVGPNASEINLEAVSSSVAVTMSNPMEGEVFISPANISLAANAAPAAGNSLSRVEFYQGTIRLGQDTTSPYTLVWTNPGIGSYVLRAVATDSGGLVKTSAPVSIAISLSCPVSVFPQAASFTADPGSGSVGVTADSSCQWAVANVPTWMTITSLSSGTGSGSITYNLASNSAPSSRSATLDIAGQPFEITQSAADRSLPSVTILAPASNSTVKDPVVVIAGNASDNVSVALVEYRVGTNSYSAATGTTSWTAEIGLTAGTNEVAVRCRDTSGNTSPEARRFLVCAPAAAIRILSTGQGSIRGATNGQRLELGRRYALTAKPGAGYVFSNWSGTVSSVSPTVEFEMQSNLVMIANFVPNPFVNAKGLFNGLFYETPEVHHDRAGFFTFALTDRGSYSASLLTRGLRVGAKGRLTLDGKGTNQVLLRDGSSLMLTWSIDLNSADRIDGSVTDGLWIAMLAGDRSRRTEDPAVQPGQFTFVILGNPSQETAPGGDGYGTFSVDAKGTARMKAFLADNTRFAARAHLSRTGNWPCYASLYKGGGAILGWIAFRDRPATDLDGVLSWSRPATPGAALYPLGFASESALIGSRYERPDPSSNLMDVPNPIVRLGGGNLVTPLTNAIAIVGSVVQNLGSNALTLKCATSSGLFSGSAIPPSGTPLNFNGAIISKANFGSGYFVGTNQTGVVVVEGSP